MNETNQINRQTTGVTQRCDAPNQPVFEGTLYTFHGGVHPEEHKDISSGQPIAPAFIPSEIIVSVQQHIGEAGRHCVAVGDHVDTGQIIAQADGYMSVASHAPTSGTVTAIAPHPVPHPSGLPGLCIHIQPDGKNTWVPRTPTDYLNEHPSTLRNLLRDMGIAGLGGAVFPTFIKLNPGKIKQVPTLLLNGGECEPWITCDDAIMRERAEDILQGAAVMRHLLQSDQVLVGIEDNKPEAIAAMYAATKQVGFPVEIVTIPTLYPSGGAKQMIKIITGK
jgi:electron transport complex protein RnfC